MSSIKNFLVYLSIGIVSKLVFGNDMSFFIASTDPSFESRKKLIKNIILINFLMFIYRISYMVYQEI